MRLKSFAPAFAVLVASSGLLAVYSSAQNPPEPSIAEAAKRNRAQKKIDGKPGVVITDDNLNRSASSAASSSPAATQGASTNVAATTVAPGQPEVSKEDAEKRKAEIAAVKQQVQDKQTEVELAKRLLDLDRDAFLSNTDYSRDTAGKAKIYSEEADLKQKQDDLEKLKTKLQTLSPETANPAPAKP